MKKFIAITFLLSAFGFAQQKTDVNPNFYLLGTLSDYMGRNQFSFKKDVIETYSEFEKPLVIQLTKMFKENVLLVDTIKSKVSQKKYDIVNKDINTSINSFYDFENYSLTHPKKDTIFKGKLKSTIFKNDSEKISFLLGCLSRFSSGTVTLTEKEFCLQFANSSSKFLLSQKIIAELGFTINKIETLPNIPRINRIYFSVDEKNYLLFREYNLLGIELQNNLLNNYSRRKK